MALCLLPRNKSHNEQVKRRRNPDAGSYGNMGTGTACDANGSRWSCCFLFLTFDSLLLRTRLKHFQWLATLLHCAQENERKERPAIERKDEWTTVQNKNGKYFIYGQCFARKFFQTKSSLFVHTKKEVWGKSRSFPLKGFFPEASECGVLMGFPPCRPCKQWTTQTAHSRWVRMSTGVPRVPVVDDIFTANGIALCAYCEEEGEEWE